VLLAAADHAFSWLHDVLDNVPEYAEAVVSPGVPPPEVPLQDTVAACADATNGLHLVLCYCVRELSRFEGDWVLDSRVAHAFYRKRGLERHDEGKKEILKLARNSASRGGFINVGRKHYSTDTINIPPPGTPSAEWSNELYLSLTNAGLEQLMVGPEDASRMVLGDSGMGALYKKKLCRYFEKNGYCSRGNKCAFAHGPGELGSPGSPEHVNSRALMFASDY